VETNKGLLLIISCRYKKKPKQDKYLYNTTQHYFQREQNSTIFHRFLTANFDSVLSFFPARQVSEKIFNESSKTEKNKVLI
jgi:hypothetical protein